MKSYVPGLLRLLLAPFLIFLLVSCSDQDNRPASESFASAADDTIQEHVTKHLDPKYVCPMHPQIVKDEPGGCPICGMDLVAKFFGAEAAASTLPTIAPPSESVAEAKDDTAIEHALKHRDPKYICPMHPQIIKDEPGDCPLCGMDLVEKFFGQDATASTLPTIAPASESLAEAQDDTAAEHALKHQDPTYVCPMHPQIVKGEPGNCPICGMNLVEKKVEPRKQRHPTVQLTNTVIQNMGVRTQPATLETMQKQIRTVGRIDYDETRLTHVHPRATGWIEKLHFRAEGDPVKRGQLLGDMYSPEILSAQVDYLIALKQANTVRKEKARNGLRLLGVAEATIKRIESRGESQNTVPLYAPSSGVMTVLTAREGMYVKPETEIFTIADLSRIWVWVDVFEHQIDWLKRGLTAVMSVPAYPGQTWTGQVDYIYPELDAESRTLRIRLAFDNPNLLLKANMFAEIEIFSEPKQNTLVIPATALIETGERSSVVTALGGGRFQPKDVVTGIRSNGEIEILEGLSAGEEVVVSGQFLIDSEASLQASFMRMMEGM